VSTNLSEIADFQKKNNYTFPMATDPKRDVYGKFATAYIPRTYLVNKEGRIVYQSVGFAEPEFKKLLKAIKKECRPARAL
jgi:peroxiredoxin